MDTTLMIKTNKKLRDEAKLVALELGIPLTTVINAMLKQFVREKKFSISAVSAPTKERRLLWEHISSEMDTNKSILKSFSNADNLIKHLKLL
ncbi:MAG: hypothetical protein NUV47_02365 [Patescibacteria group bacterium]|nr:hypothetical protein [Patescibacteria group bacterium]